MAKSERLDKKVLMRLHNEIKLAEKRNEAELLPVINENIARYTGRYIPNVGVDWDIILNEVYPIVQFNIPSIHFRNPRAFLKPKHKNFIAKRRNPQTLEMEEVFLDSGKSARTQEAILNYTIPEIEYKKELRKVLFDALLAPHGVLWHGYKGEFGMTEEQSLTIKKEQVFVKRISPLRFLFDPAVNIANLDEARWIARSFDIPLMELVEDDTLNVTKEIKGKIGFGQSFMVDEKGNFVQSNATDKLPNTSRVKPLLEFADKDFRDSRDSRFVTMYELFLRPTKKQKRDGEKGKLILLTDEQFEDLRNNKNPYKYDSWMAKILEFNSLSDATFGLDDVSTYKSIADNKNIMRNLQIRNAQENSKVWVFLAKEGTSEEDIEKVKVGDQTIVTFDGDSIHNKAQVSSAGLAASQELYLIDTRLDRELQDKSFVTDQKRGFLQSGEESATNAKIRAMGGAVRPAYRQDIMADFLKDSYGCILALLKQFMPIKEAVRIMGTLDVEWSDNFTKEEIQAPVDVDIDAISLQPENPDKEIQELTVILNLMQQAIANPALERKLLQEKKTFNIAPIINQLLFRLRIRDPEIFRNIRPEEQMGFVSVAELQAAQQNVIAAIQGEEPPSPPAPGQDHKARLEMYTAIFNLLQALGIQADILQRLIEQQQLIFEEETKVRAPRAGQKVQENARNRAQQEAEAQ
jgi:hypothetical protein